MREQFKLLKVKLKNGVLTGSYLLNNLEFTVDSKKKKMYVHPDMNKIIEAFQPVMANFLKIKNQERTLPSGIVLSRKGEDHIGIKITGTLECKDNQSIRISTPEFDPNNERDVTAALELDEPEENREYEIMDIPEAIYRLETELYEFVFKGKESQTKMNFDNEEETD